MPGANMRDITGKCMKAIRNPEAALRILLLGSKVDECHNLVVDVILGDNKRRCRMDTLKTGFIEFDEINGYTLRRTDISDHLLTLFVESLAVEPRLIVELGVRDGQSTFVLERVAKLCNSRLVRVDLDDVRFTVSYHNWEFVKSDDTEFAKPSPGAQYSRNPPLVSAVVAQVEGVVSRHQPQPLL